MDLLPHLLAICAAIIFGLSSHFQRRGVATIDSLTGTFVSLATVSVIFWVFAPVFVDWRWLGTGAAALFALCGLLFPAMGQRLSIASVGIVGPSMTASIAAFAPLFAAIPAVILLGEHLNLQALIGILIMVGALVLSSIETGTARRGWPLAALLLPLGAAVIRGFVQPVAKIGYGEVPSPFFASLVMASVSTLVIGTFLLMRGRDRIRVSGRAGYVWFALNGITIGLGILVMQNALRLGSVVAVASLVATAPLWTLLFGAVIFRHERLGLRDAVISALVVIGAILIVTR